MNTMIYLRNKRRGNFDYCEECGAALKWVYDGYYWIACDVAPVLFYPHIGRCKVVYKRELIENALLYRTGLSIEQQPLIGLSPHIFSCRKGETYVK